MKQLDRRIDYVFFRPPRNGGQVRVQRAHVVRDIVDGLHPSDHFAVVADLEIWG
ncbi:hypothetical protein [Phytoactinopolyspora alkaliphila]|uniref:hypothetical protein n=1 Tax=Phytoactinopolyspora alkaliphila TaxID=1783498 RepID=UPI001FE67C86|nr:hypothetical protein [Phytoactinopolyspora alkaliphila]